jgi:hypothetical protein
MHRRIAAGLTALALAAGLSACTGGGPTYADLQRDQNEQDRLPEHSVGADTGDPFAIDVDSTRLVAVQGDTEVFLASATEEGQPRICIIVFAATQPFRACGSGDRVGLSDSVDEYTVLSDAVVETALDPADGWTKISENVFTRPVEPTTSDTQ